MQRLEFRPLPVGGEGPKLRDAIFRRQRIFLRRRGSTPNCAWYPTEPDCPRLTACVELKEPHSISEALDSVPPSPACDRQADKETWQRQDGRHSEAAGASRAPLAPKFRPHPACPWHRRPMRGPSVLRPPKGARGRAICAASRELPAPSLR